MCRVHEFMGCSEIGCSFAAEVLVSCVSTSRNSFLSRFSRLSHCLCVTTTGSFMGTKGEITVDQAHRGACVSTDCDGYASINPLFMKYTPTNGMFSGQGSYGVKSFENFIDACRDIKAGVTKPSDYNDGSLATVHTTMQGTAILEAGRMSLDMDCRPVDILYNSNGIEPIRMAPHEF